MLSKIFSAGLHGIDAYPVTVEVEISRQGLPGWHFVGLPERVVQESKDRVTAALRNSGFQLCYQKNIVNLAPARRRKQGNYYDLPIAVGLLASAELMPSAPLPRCLFAGELLLSGELHYIPGALSLALLARETGMTLVVPAGNEREVQVVRGLSYVAPATVKELVAWIEEKRPPQRAMPPHTLPDSVGPDLADVKGHPLARRALEIAAAGNHHILLHGPPGVGKTMLAERLPGILPPMVYDEALETTQIYSAAGEEMPYGLIQHRPFRAPHHSASASGLAGGSAHPHIGEMGLAHNGVLFLDEFPEFRRDALELFRQPLESGRMTITRAGYRVSYPACFLCVIACNPCRCGYYGHPKTSCTCTMQQIHTYRSKLSGPMLDRIDLHVRVEHIEAKQLETATPGESSTVVRPRVLAARARQAARYESSVLVNAGLSAAQTRRVCKLPRDGYRLLHQCVDRYSLSARVYDRLLRIARTIADLAGTQTIETNHIAEAIQYRSLDRPL